MSDPTKRFTGLADIYASARPTYPDEVIDHIIRTAKLKPGDEIADVGAGTGISSRLFAERGFNINAVEPNDDMRQKGEAEGTAYGGVRIVYLRGDAEHTGLSNGSQALTLAAQAFHWFRAQEALVEFHRITRDGGWVALMWNERDESDALTAAYGNALRLAPETVKIEAARQAAGEPLLGCELFQRASKVSFGNEQVVDLDGYLRRAFSASYAPKEEALANRVREALTKAFAQHAKNGLATLKYTTSVYMAQKA